MQTISEWTKFRQKKDYVFPGTASRAAKSRKFDTNLNNSDPRLQSLSALGGYFVQLHVLLGHIFCPLSGDKRLSVSRRLKMYYFYGKVNQGHEVCLPYKGSPYL